MSSKGNTGSAAIPPRAPVNVYLLLVFILLDVMRRE
jgi:hypothetical protein